MRKMLRVMHACICQAILGFGGLLTKRGKRLTVVVSLSPLNAYTNLCW